MLSLNQDRARMAHLSGDGPSARPTSTDQTEARTTPTAEPVARPIAKFISGSIPRHVITMTATASIGLVAIFLVDALNLFYISLLGVSQLAAAIGFGSTILFFTTSISIGFTIAAGALVARTLGRGDRIAAAQIGGASIVFSTLAGIVTTLALYPFTRPLLVMIGATGETLELAYGFMQIVIPSTTLMMVGMAASGILRGVGDAKRAMFVTLASGIVSAIFDPILILWLDWGLNGAAISTVLSRLALLMVGLHGAGRIHKLIVLPNMKRLMAAAKPFFLIGIPAVLTQIATPVGNVFVMIEMARFGDEAVAGFAIVGRLMPVAFGVIFALPGAVGPIIGQNFGAQNFTRVQQTLRDSLWFTILYVLVVWALLAIFRNQIASLFGAEGEARDVVIFFCLFAAGSFLFNGILFVANSVFNNLGYASYATIFNWGRSTLGIIPFVWLGAKYFGPLGVVGGWGLGAVGFGLIAMIYATRIVNRHTQLPPDLEEDIIKNPPPAANSPYSSGKAATL